MAAFSQGWLQGCEGGCAARGAQGCPSKQGPCSPGGCVLGQGPCHLPGSALSLPGELPTEVRGEAVRRRSDPLAGQGPALEWVLHRSGLLTAADHYRTFPGEDFPRSRARQGLPKREGSCSFSLLLWVIWVGNGTQKFICQFWRRH